eukprot:g58614.t1
MSTDMNTVCIKETEVKKLKKTKGAVPPKNRSKTPSVVRPFPENSTNTNVKRSGEPFGAVFTVRMAFSDSVKYVELKEGEEPKMLKDTLISRTPAALCFGSMIGAILAVRWWYSKTAVDLLFGPLTNCLEATLTF